MEYSIKTPTFRDYLRIIFRHKIVFIILPLAIMIPTLIWLELPTPVYEAEVKMFVVAQKQTEAGYYRGFINVLNITAEHTELVKSNIVIERVAKALEFYQQRPLDYEKRFSSRLKAALIDYNLKKFMPTLEMMSPEEKQAFFLSRAISDLNGSIEAIPIKETNLFSIKAKDFDPGVAAIIANSVSRSYIIFDLEQQIAELQLKYGEKHSTVLQLKDYIAEFQKTLDGKPIPDLEAIGPASVKIMQQAQVVGQTSGVNKQLLRIFAFFGSIFLSIIFAFLFDYLDQTFKTHQDIESYLNIPFLGSISKRKSKDNLLIKDINPVTSYAMSFQNLSEQVYLMIRDKNLKTLLMTGAEETEGTAAVTANLGIYLANKTGHKVLIVDANLRNSAMSKLFNISNGTGLTDVLERKISFLDAVQDIGNNLYFLPAGDTVFNPITLLDSSMVCEVITKAREQYEIVLINCADLKNFITDVVILSSIADGTILVINEGKIKRQVVKSAISPLEQKKANIIGAILNNRTYVIPKIIYKIT